MNLSLLLFCISGIIAYLWIKTRKENDENFKFIILNTLDYYQSLKPEHLAIKVHRRFNAEFLLDPNLIYQIVYSHIIGNKYKQCSIIFKYNARDKTYMKNLEIWDGEVVSAVCPQSLKLHGSSLFEYLIKELEATHGINICEHNKNASEEYEDLAIKFKTTKENL